VENILKKIVASRRKDVEAAKALMPVDKILEKLSSAPAGRSFKGAMKAAKGLALIASQGGEGLLISEDAAGRLTAHASPGWPGPVALEP
jgi:hypothetical protein